jgi:hypothetical protein
VAAARLSDEILGWARLAGYAWDTETGSLTTRLDGCHTQLSVRVATRGRMELREDIDGDSRMLLYALNLDVVERHLFGLFADDIREDLDLGFLPLRWEEEDLAEGFGLTDMVRGYRTLQRSDGAPVAAAPDPTLSLLALVPLSHYLKWAVSDLKPSFLNSQGAPLLRDGRYASRDGAGGG